MVAQFATGSSYVVVVFFADERCKRPKLLKPLEVPLKYGCAFTAGRANSTRILDAKSKTLALNPIL